MCVCFEGRGGGLGWTLKGETGDEVAPSGGLKPGGVGARWVWG